MKLSIIIVSYNVSELLDKCLKSTIISAENIDHEIFVVDNNSQDSSTHMVENKYPSVKLIKNSENLGFSKANNQGIKISKGEYILILNPDTELMRDTLNKMLDYMENSPPNVAMATCKIELTDGSIDRDCRRSFPTPTRAFFHFAGFEKIFKRSKIFDSYYKGHIPEDQETEVDACVGAFMLIKSNVVKKVGPFDEDYFFYGEDLDLCYRIKKSGYKIFYTPITKIIHHKGASSGIKHHSKQLSKASLESKKRSIKESTRAMELFYKKHYKKLYPSLVTSTVLASINLVKYIRLVKISLLW